MDGMKDNNAINPDIKDKKTQTFNLIIGVATLLIALLGATFAYFTATARSAEGEVNVRSAMVSINFDRGTAIKATNLIPSSERVAILKYQKEVEAFDEEVDGDFVPDFDEFLEGDDQSGLSEYLNRKCVDANGREVCYVFWFSVKSDGQIGETTDILGTIGVEKNEFTNLAYLVYEVEYRRDENDKIVRDKYGFGIVESYRLVSEFPEIAGYPPEDIPFGRFDSIVNTYDGDDNITGTKYPVNCLFGYAEDAAGKEIDDSSRCKVHTLTNGVEHNYQILIWLEETGSEQLEQGKEFAGTVTVEVKGDISGLGGGGIVTGRE